MNTSSCQWKKSTYVGASRVVRRPRSAQRTGKRLNSIIRANQVKLNPEPVSLGAQPEKIRVVPIMEGNRIKALRVSCACGCESTFDIQYAEGATAE